TEASLKASVTALTARLVAQQQKDRQASGTEASLKASVTALTQKNSELMAQTQRISRDYDEKIQALTARLAAQKQKGRQASGTEASLKEGVSTITKNNKELDKKKLITNGDKYSYALGVTFFENIKKDIASLRWSTMKINIDLFSAGFNERYENNSKMSITDAEKFIKNFDDNILSLRNKSIKEITNKLKGIKYKKLTDSIFIVADKINQKKYSSGDFVFYSVYEKKLSGEVIMNNLNLKIKYGDPMPEFFKQAIKISGKNGRVTIYGLAGDFYDSSSLPSGVMAEMPIKLTIIIK
ncbi:TPA: FKBP-type peptidyl-prolyl cis-trans isomerase N-terminal domain-containing protein, partial [Klebsiella quasipneumoniae subsp. similipneumoniae]